MKRLLTLSIVLFISVISFAQRMYRYGYIVNWLGDTLSGQISFDHWKAPERVFFKGNDGRKVQYSLYDVKTINFPASDLYRMFIDKEGPKIFHALFDGDHIQVYEGMGESHQYYIGFGNQFLPTIIVPTAFKPLPGKIQKKGRK